VSIDRSAVLPEVGAEDVKQGEADYEREQRSNEKPGEGKSEAAKTA
jgi:hypothetical protein